MRLILNSEEVLGMFNNEKPTVNDFLSNNSIKQISKGFDIISIYKDKMNTTNLNNYVIELEIKDSNGN